MIEHVYNRTSSLGIKSTYIATDSEDIAEVITKAGGKFIMTKPECASGTDRIYEALQTIKDNGNIKYVINLQGDMPFIDPAIITKVIDTLKKSNADIVTPVAEIDRLTAEAPSNVKVVIGKDDKALYFSRSMIPHGAEKFWYHIGIYGYTTSALKKFVHLPQSPLEKQESLEQLRALENDMTITVCYAESVPISVDTDDDLSKARMQHDSLFVG